MHVASVISTVGLLAAGAAAHGAVTSYVIAGTAYPGYQGFSPSNSPNVIQRQWSDYNPVTSVTDAKLRCNGGTSASLNASVKPGDSVSAIWGQWTHSQGPILVWMYKCAGAFSACDGSGSGWFKIDEAGFHGDGVKVFLDTETPSGWDIAKLVGGNKQWTSTIPAGLAPGNYLIRHELIALHQANSPQFYAECAQIVVTGSGTAEPSAAQKAAIPGYCKQGDANIKVPINDHSIPQTYVIPGPPVFKGSAAVKAREFTA
ncbi:glycoside hydrolase [Phialemonium atrogriseum]|uniref:lytic cellulose monooxygenase (C4-dehydrogenating) n=1 Tax=Phialemonium atrogriseum TaxID=1093897 RepID=A0AAJ0BZT5_9PEZI|nr:glycoside hydrolase [Phialemonium atrogriseum]KAK1767540.1 glycoside hydrolase [Phialemonium atrogriseum]